MISEPDFKNVVIFVCDSLRYDYFPEELEKEAKSEVIPTLTQSLNSPTGFTTLFTGLSPKNHSVRNFLQDLDEEKETLFDKFEKSSFWDGKGVSTLNRHIFKSEGGDLDEMGENFVWIERIMDTHLPYGRSNHNQEFDFNMPGLEYIERGKKGEFDLEEDYQEGVEKATQHIKNHIDYLEQEELLNDTLVVITSDHGEALGERFLGRKRYEHNYPPIREIAQVPTLFYNYDLDSDCMRTMDIVPTVLSILGKEVIGDGEDLSEETVSEGRNVMETKKASFDTKWRFEDEKWCLEKSSSVERALKTFIGDIKRDVYRQMPNGVKDRLSNNNWRQKNSDETQDIDI